MCMYCKVPTKCPLRRIHPPPFGPNFLHRFIVVCSKRLLSLLCSDRDKNGTCIVPVLCVDDIVSGNTCPWVITMHCACMYKVLRSMRAWVITTNQKLPAPSKRPPPHFLDQSCASAHGHLLSTLRYTRQHHVKC